MTSYRIIDNVINTSESACKHQTLINQDGVFNFAYYKYVILRAPFFLLAMTIKQARKVLGKEADKFSDEEIERFIDVATFLKDLFFVMHQKQTSPKL